PGSIAAMGGIQPGTLIMQVNRQPVKTANDFKRVLGKSRRDKRVLLLVRKGDVQQYLVLSW
nr:PDZ domain-containing protein [Gammaproteobacteria bacterium]